MTSKLFIRQPQRLEIRPGALQPRLEARLRRFYEWFGETGGPELRKWETGGPLRSAAQVRSFHLGLVARFAVSYFRPEIADKAREWVDQPVVPPMLDGSFALALLDADPYLWVQEIWDAVSEMKVPQHDLASLGVARASFHIPETDMHTSLGLFGGFLLQSGPEVPTGISRILQYNLFFDPDDHRVRVMSSGVPNKGTYPDDLGEDAQKAHQQLAAMLSFIQSPYMIQNKQAPRRSYRRAMERTGRPDSALVTFTYLRHPKSLRPVDHDPSPEARSYRYRWLVSGHIRNQPYPAEGVRRLIWIDPYVKGPEGAPLKPRVFKVAR